MMRTLIPLLCFSLLAFGCMNKGQPGVVVINKRHAQFGAKALPETWQKKSFRHADLFFEHVSLDATIHLTAQCEKFSDSPLEALTSQMLVEMGTFDIISQKRLSLAGREALVSEITVNLDGVNRFLKIMVLRKNRCLFDAVLSARARSADIVNDFDVMVETFWAEADL